MFTLVATLVPVVIGVALIALGLHTHPEVEIAGRTYPLSTVRQFKPLRGAFPIVQVGRDWWDVALGGLIIVEGLTIGALSVRRFKHALMGRRSRD